MLEFVWKFGKAVTNTDFNTEVGSSELRSVLWGLFQWVQIVVAE